MNRLVCLLLVAACFEAAWSKASAQPAPEADAAKLRAETDALQKQVDDLLARERKVEADGMTRSKRPLVADVEVYSKAADWILRHEEFYKPDYVKQTYNVLDAGRKRAALFADGNLDWGNRPGRFILGYYSNVDGSAQPYAITLPAGFDPKSGKRWPLHLVLHGRAGTMNEVNFIVRHDGKPAPEGVDWIQLDVFGRTNNAYRWSGETDVFEALKDVQQRYRIDDRRITLRGFSMGGAGAWHLGLHHPSTWCSVGPGAGFVDTYKYQKIKEQLPEYQHRALGIYDAVDYALNAADVPVCTYGGELDAQLVASTEMVEAAKQLGVDIKLIIGPQTGHKFHPESEKEFMAFHLAASAEGRPAFPGRKSIRFTTRTLKFNRCEWLTIEEIIRQYEPATVEGAIDTEQGIVKLTTDNVASLTLSRDIAQQANIDGTILPLSFAADNLLPTVLYVKGRDGWEVVGYDETRKFDENEFLQKRHGLQGPIDDAFTDSFVCVRGTGTPWSATQQAWADQVLATFEQEFDKWLRGRIRIVDDTDVTEEMMQESNLILFGDPGSNSVMAKVVGALPLTWTRNQISANGHKYDPETHGLSLIYPNPLQPRRYIVINSGHTFHEPQFKASNAQLYPRLGDFAVLKLNKAPGDGGFEETVVDAAIFNGGWQFPPPRSEP